MDMANRESAICPSRRPRIGVLCASCFLTLLIGCSSTPGDPLEKLNRAMFRFNSDLDRGIIKPVADAYVKVIPRPIRTGVANGFSNLFYLDVIANDLLQAKWGQGLNDAGRMAVNSTVGVAGIFDVATKWGMPVHANNLGTTLGKWGLPPGPYLVLPFLGPSTVRDAPDFAMLWFTNPVYWIRPGWYVTVPLGALATVDARSRVDFLIRFRSDTALDPYVFTRDAYLQYRNAQIRGEKAPPGQDIYDEDLGPTSQPANPSGTPATKPASRVAIIASDDR
jgi:phospholipid-binding lipoprotein MlaA